MIRTSKLTEDYSSDEDEALLSPTYGALGTTMAGGRQRNGTTHSADVPSGQKSVNLGKATGERQRE